MVTNTYYPSRYYHAASDGTASRYYFLGALRIAERHGSGNSPVIYRHGNQVDSTIYTTVSGSGKPRDYTAFGDQRPRSQFQALDTDYTYGGQYGDGTGLVYMNARYYDPNVGLFISPDSIIPDPSNVLDYNRYLYARGNPVSNHDPSGHASKPAMPPMRLSRDAFSNWWIAVNCFFAAACHEQNGIVEVYADPLSIEVAVVSAPANAALNAADRAIAKTANTYLRHVAPDAFEELMSFGVHNWDQFDNVIQSVSPDTIVRGMTDRAGNQVLLRTGSRDAGLRHIVGRHLSDTFKGPVTTSFPEWTKVGDVSTAIGDVVANGTRILDQESGYWVYEWTNATFGKMNVVIDEVGDVVTAYPLQ